MADENLNETPESPTPEIAPVSLELILDGAAFIKSLGQKTAQTLHREETSQGAVFIKEVGHGIANEVIVGQYRRDAQGDTVFDKLATMDRCVCMAIQHCLAKADGSALFTASEVDLMYRGSNQAQFRDFLTEVYDLVVKWNPHLHPAGNATALRRLRPWLA